MFSIDISNEKEKKNLLVRIPNSCPCILSVHSIETTYEGHLRKRLLLNKIALMSEEYVFLF